MWNIEGFGNNTVSENFSLRLCVEELYPFEENFPTAKMGQNLKDIRPLNSIKSLFSIQLQWQYLESPFFHVGHLILSFVNSLKNPFWSCVITDGSQSSNLQASALHRIFIPEFRREMGWKDWHLSLGLPGFGIGVIRAPLNDVGSKPISNDSKNISKSGTWNLCLKF